MIGQYSALQGWKRRVCVASRPLVKTSSTKVLRTVQRSVNVELFHGNIIFFTAPSIFASPTSFSIALLGHSAPAASKRRYSVHMYVSVEHILDTAAWNEGPICIHQKSRTPSPGGQSVIPSHPYRILFWVRLCITLNFDSASSAIRQAGNLGKAWRTGFGSALRIIVPRSAPMLVSLRANKTCSTKMRSWASWCALKAAFQCHTCPCLYRKRGAT